MDTRNNKVDYTDWIELKTSGNILTRRSYHAAAVFQNQFYIYGGYEINEGILSDFQRIDLSKITNQMDFRWEEVPVKPSSTPRPKQLHRHALIAHGNKLYMFGGIKGMN